LPDEQWNEIVEYLSVNDAGELTFKGFTELYSLQTGAPACSSVRQPLKLTFQFGFSKKTTRQRRSRT
jgi:hypothetical protein